jgi:hypothetical protein
MMVVNLIMIGQDDEPERIIVGGQETCERMLGAVTFRVRW